TNRPLLWNPLISVALTVVNCFSEPYAIAQTQTPAAATPAAPAKIILDTDIGDDIDDAFALGLALNSPEVKILGITTAWGDTKLRATLVDRLLAETGNSQIPVAEGIVTTTSSSFTQARWAQAGPLKNHEAAVDFLLEQIRNDPSGITLVAI